MNRPKVFVAMSGGVDSSVAAALLVKDGNFDVIGAHMKCWSDSPSTALRATSDCSSEVDAEDARRVAEKLNIPFYVFDFEREYRDRVFAYMVREYSAGRTPNPDVMCNKEIKFGIFLEKALALGADFVATGHYVRAERRELSKSSRRQGELGLRQWRSRPAESAGGRAPLERANRRFEKAHVAMLNAKKFSERDAVTLYTAVDQTKDQSYFLWTLTQEQLKHCLFPIGDYLKSEVREMAKEFNLPTAAKKDSQGLCFVGEIKFDDFLREVLPKKEGMVITTSGKEVGTHDGLHFYTIGQRHGIGIGGGIPYYVAEKKFETNTLVVGEGPYDEGLFQKELAVADANWISGTKPKLPLGCEARIRYRQPLQKATLTSGAVGTPGVHMKSLKLSFNEPQRAVTCGQSAVFYKDREMLGGGIIL